MSESKRIVFSFFNLGGYHLVRLDAVSKMLKPLGWVVSVIEFSPYDAERPWGSGFAASSVDVYRLFKTQEEFSAFSARGRNACLVAQLEQLKPDVLAIPGWGHSTARTMLRWARRRGVPTILMSDSKSDDKPRRTMIEWIKSLIVRQFDAAIVAGVRHREYLRSLGMSDAQIFYHYDVVDNDYFRDKAEADGQNPEETLNRYPGLKRPFYLVATRFLARKNLLLLLEAYGYYVKQCAGENPYQLMLVGSGGEEGKIRQMINELGLEKLVLLPGFVEYEQMAGLYGVSSALIHPALTEQWGLVVNEACASSLPVLLSDTTGAVEMIIDGVSGLLFDPKDVDRLAELLLQFHHMTEAEKQKMGEEASRAVADYSPNAFGEGIVDALAYIVNSRQPGFSLTDIGR
jgi:1,2-diacylglycerol 3-alpha-glucosyltransferase